MREEYLRIESFEEFHVTDCKGKQEVNEHMRYRFQGIIPIGKMKEYAAKGAEECRGHVFAIGEHGREDWLCGVVEDIQLDVAGQTCMMQMTLVSGTILMDIRKHTRTFQSSTLMYHQLLDTCNSAYEKSGKIMTVGKDRQIGQMVVQYQETDWEFVKRLASQNQTVVVADTETWGSKYYFGLPKRDSTITGDMQEYRTQYDMKSYWEKKNQGLTVTKHDFVYYIWESRDIYQLGDRGLINGKPLIVWKIETSMRGNNLYHTYYMKPESAFRTAVSRNPQIVGASLFGTVINVKDEQVKVAVQNDENAENTGNRWFPYATMYSSSDGSGWYCMPEIGDSVRLYFPTDKEEEAYAASAYHEVGSSRRKDPSCKFWRNKQGKEIRLAKDRILMTNNKGTYVELSDDEGIEIVSSGAVRIQAEAAMEISSNHSQIELNARTKVSLRQGSTEMKIDKSGFNVKGSRVKL